MNYENYSIEKLNDTNYITWKLQMKSLLICNELWSYVNGDIPKPTDKSQLPLWNVKDAKALSLIILNVQHNQLEYIKTVQTSSEAWKTLEKIHTLYKRPAKQMQLYKKIFQMKKHINNTMSDHINEFQNYVNQLDESGIKLPDELLSIMLLNTLPSEYENFNVAIRSRDDIPDINILKIKLIDLENRLIDRSYQDKKKTYQDKEFKNLGGCYFCGKSGHKAANCYLKNNKPERLN